MKKTAVVCGAGGFIGWHLVNRLKSEGYYVIGLDLDYPTYAKHNADRFIVCDLRNPDEVNECIPNSTIEIYQLAADMGGAGFIFTGDNDAAIMHNSALCNLNVLERAREVGAKIFFSSSACVYPSRLQTVPGENVRLEESLAYPAEPDSEYGWEKLFSERLYLAYAKNYGMQVRIARFHNVYGPYGTWRGGREKAPAAICRKIADAETGGRIEVWGSGEQSRSFLYIDDCIDGIRLLMESQHTGPFNIGSEEMVTINELVNLVARIAGKYVIVDHLLDKPVGVNARNSHNDLVQQAIWWTPKVPLVSGLQALYAWIVEQLFDPNNQ
jgi:GDP-D-mannose 3',5'-epimerase